MREKQPSRGAARTWSVITGLIVIGVFMQSVFAGLLLSGETWSRDAHGFAAVILIAAALLAGIGAAITLRGVTEDGRRLATMLLALAGVLAAQTAVGHLSAEGRSVLWGANLLWLHVPLGVALVVLTVQPARVARQLSA